MSIILSIFLIPFWAAVLAFCPIMCYLILHPLYSIRAEKALQKRIFLLTAEEQLKKEKSLQIKASLNIYGVCVWLIIITSGINWFNKGAFTIQPFDILSSISVILFCIAVVTYIPFAAYLMIKEPWKYQREGAILTKMFATYGAGILIFSFIFFIYWSSANDIFLGVQDLFQSFFIIIGGSVVLSYMPTLIYAFFTIKNPLRSRSLKLGVAFLIYGACFVIFSSIYCTEWYLRHHKPTESPQEASQIKN